MSSRNIGANSTTLMISVAILLVVALAIGLDTRVNGFLSGILQAFRVSTGLHPENLFRNVSLTAEGRAYAETLRTQLYLQYYFIGAVIAAILSVVFVFTEGRRPIWRHQGLFVAFLILLFLPLALSTVSFSGVLAYQSVQVVCMVALIVLAVFAIIELLRIPPRSMVGKVLLSLIISIIALQGIAIPAYMATLFIRQASA